jgi:hypothetical protein
VKAPDAVGGRGLGQLFFTHPHQETEAALPARTNRRGPVRPKRPTS